MIRFRRATAVSRDARFTGGPNTSPSRIHHRAAGQTDAYVGHPAVPADHVDDPLGGVVRADRVVVHEQHRVADAS